MSEWKTVRLGDVCEIAAGQGAPQGDSNYCDEGTDCRHEKKCF